MKKIALIMQALMITSLAPAATIITFETKIHGAHLAEQHTLEPKESIHLLQTAKINIYVTLEKEQEGGPTLRIDTIKPSTNEIVNTQQITLEWEEIFTLACPHEDIDGSITFSCQPSEDVTQSECDNTQNNTPQLV